jgi:hypothetical protein
MPHRDSPIHQGDRRTPFGKTRTHRRAWLDAPAAAGNLHVGNRRREELMEIVWGVICSVASLLFIWTLLRLSSDRTRDRTRM